MAGSAALRSRVATSLTADWATPASAKAPEASSHKASESAPRLDPTPMTTDAGRNRTSRRSGGRAASVTVTRPPATSPAPASPPSLARSASGVGRGHPAEVGSISTSGGAPSSQRRVTPATSPSARNPGRSSRLGNPDPSVAVVMTASAPSQAATCRARSLAPPWCPPQSATAKRPWSSTHTTAGSVCLVASKGATARNAIPTAPTRTSPSTEPHSTRTVSTNRPPRCSYGRRLAISAPAAETEQHNTRVIPPAPSTRRLGSRPAGAPPLPRRPRRRG